MKSLISLCSFILFLILIGFVFGILPMSDLVLHTVGVLGGVGGFLKIIDDSKETVT